MKRMDEKQQESQAIKDMVSLVHEYELSLIPDNNELRERYLLSDAFYQKMDQMIEGQKKMARRKKLRRFAAAAAAAIVVFIGVTHPQTISKAGQWLIRWYHDHISFQFVEDTGNIEVPRYELSYVPEGYRLELDDYSSPGGFTVYVNDEGWYLDFSYGSIDDGLEVDNENKDLLKITGSRGEIIYYLRAKNPEAESSMTWISEDGTLKFNLMGNFSQEELIKIQEGIHVVK
ncbi:MAG: DUF4367 domain-containing protein [Lachnospiraceae bacterium]|nr:DUF4367 domain-containing protein [Lachnospiraceae bacterium]